VIGGSAATKPGGGEPSAVKSTFCCASDFALGKFFLAVAVILLGMKCLRE